MNSVTLEVASREKINNRLLRAFDGEAQGQFISFESPELLFKVISGKRWDLLKIMTGAGGGEACPLVRIIVDRGEGIRYKLASCHVGTGRIEREGSHV